MSRRWRTRALVFGFCLWTGCARLEEVVGILESAPDAGPTTSKDAGDKDDSGVDAGNELDAGPDAGVTQDSFRDPYLQPFASTTLWNTAIGSQAVWSLDTDADTQAVRSTGPDINAGQWSMGAFYRGTENDPIITVTDTDNPPYLGPEQIHAPADVTPCAPAADSSLVLYDDTQPRWMYSYYACTAVDGGFACSNPNAADVCATGLGADDPYGYDRETGVIRAWELEAGSVHHMLSYTLPPSLTMSGPTWDTGIAWPMTHEDYDGPWSYTGSVLFGSTIGIPASVDLSTLGLSAGGLILAHALQDYGAIQRGTGGNNGVSFSAEPSAEGSAMLTQMRNDLQIIVAQLSVLRNQSAKTPNGGGTPRQPAVAPIDPTICP